MVILHPWLWRAASLIASNPRVRAKTAELFEQEVKPRAEDAWRQTKPKLDAAKADIQQIARETDPRKNPRKFASRVKQRFLDRKDRR